MRMEIKVVGTLEFDIDEELYLDDIDNIDELTDDDLLEIAEDLYRNADMSEFNFSFDGYDLVE